MDSGVVDAHAGDEHLHIKIQNGLILEQTTQRKDECTTLKYGQQHTTKKGNKTVKQEYFQPGTLQAIRRGGLWKRETGIPLCGNKGKVECYSTSGGAYGKEVFKYDNGVLGYMASRWRKKLEVIRPNGKRWIVIEGQVSLNRSPIAARLDPDAGDLGLSSIMRDNSWNVTVYDADGITVVTQGDVKNRQKQGKWLERSKETYYISGVQVSPSLYEDDPAKWDAYEVLKVPNAQIRCSLLNKMGYDKLLERVKHKVVDVSNDGGQLVEIGAGLAGDSIRGLDKMMRLVKVICPSTKQTYVLRVPPEIASFEQARQWTFGMREASIMEGASFELVKET
jgi:hypothetical protein